MGGSIAKECVETFGDDGNVHSLDSRDGLKCIHIMSKFINLYTLNNVVCCQLYLLKLFLKFLYSFFEFL